MLIYFHGNAEDLTSSFKKLRAISLYLNVNVLGVEYPGYGIYENNGSASEAKIKEDAEYVYKYVLQ